MKGDQKLASTVLSGQPYLSGIKPEHMDVIRNAAAEAFAQERFRARQDALKGMQKLANARQSFERGLMPRLHHWKTAADERAAVDKAFKS